MSHRSNIADSLDVSDLWLVPRTGRVVFDERGNSTWQWPGQGDPFVEHGSLESMNAADLRIVEPAEIRRSKLPWTHDSERPAREYAVRSEPNRSGTELYSGTARARRLR
jgi:hypothetical protein